MGDGCNGGIVGGADGGIEVGEMFESWEVGFSDASDTAPFGTVIDFGCEQLCKVGAVGELVTGGGVGYVAGLGEYGW